MAVGCSGARGSVRIYSQRVEVQHENNTSSSCGHKGNKRKRGSDDLCNTKRLWRLQRWLGIPRRKIEAGETPQEALVREIKEELETEIAVGKLIDTIEYDYPTFHLSMDCFWAEIVSGDLVLKEHEAAKWLTKDELDTVEWLPADIGLIEKLRVVM